MKTTPTRICIIGDSTKRIVCECGRPTVLKASPEGIAISAAMKNKRRSRGFNRDGVTGSKQAHKSFGECESTVKL